jgi:hypothetical protein
MVLESPNYQAPLWSFWPSEMWLYGPVCYAVQIDTQSSTDTVVFRAY